MKKILSILTTSALTASIPAPLLANTPLVEKVKINVGTSNSNNDYVPLKEFKNISGDIYRMTIDSNDNIYFSVFANGAFVLKHGETTPENINGINNVVNSIAVDSKDNIYFGTDNGAFVLKQGESTAKKIDGISNNIQSITIDNKDNIYFGTSKGTNILQTALSWTKTQSRFTLVDSTKTKTWTRPD